MEKIKVEKKDLLYLLGLCRVVTKLPHFEEKSAKEDLEEHLNKLEKKYL